MTSRSDFRVFSEFHVIFSVFHSMSKLLQDYIFVINSLSVFSWIFCFISGGYLFRDADTIYLAKSVLNCIRKKTRYMTNIKCLMEIS